METIFTLQIDSGDERLGKAQLTEKFWTTIMQNRTPCRDAIKNEVGTVYSNRS